MLIERPHWLPERIFPFDSHFLDVAGQRVHYIDEGQGPILLCLHGNPTYSLLYRHLVLALRDDFRCLALDYPGFGLSTAAPGYGFTPSEHARVVKAFVDQLDLSGITLFGQDYGGPIGLWAAEQAPERYRGLVMGNTFAWPPGDEAALRWFSRFAGGPIGHFLIHNFNAFVRAAVSQTRVRGEPMPADVRRAYSGPFPTRQSRYPTYVFPRELRKSRPFFEEIAANLGRLGHLPLLLTWGTGDPVLSMDRFGQRFAAAFPNHRTVLLAGANHYIQEEAPDEIVAAIREWWATVVNPA